MSGNAQGLPQRMTAFVDPKTGLVSDTWWRFLQSLFQRTGGAEGSSSTDEIIQYGNMADVPDAPDPDQAVWMAEMANGGELAALPDWFPAMLGDAVAEPVDAFPDLAIDPVEPENDPALVAMMVSD